MIVCTCVNHSPTQVLEMLEVAEGEYSVSSLDKEICLFKTYQDFLHIIPQVNKKKYKYKMAVVFCSLLEEYNLDGVFNLDSEGPEITLPNQEFLDIGVFPRRVSVKKRSILDDKIVQIKKGSLLNPLMSYIYTLSSLFQKSVKFMACAYIYYGSSDDKMEKALHHLESKHGTKISDKSKEKLFSILRSRPCKEYKKAFRRLRRNKSLDGLPINNYEINYILASIKTGDEYVEFFTY